jgi:carboxypeptidase Q
MRNLVSVCALSACGLISIFTLAVGGQAPSAADVFARLLAEGYERSQVVPAFEALTIDIGPRLTASPAHKRAVDWTRQRLANYGLTNVHTEPWNFGRGWELERLTVELIEPRYLPLIAYADGWSAATSGEVVGAPVFVGGKSAAEIAAMSGKVKGAIVMTQPILTNFVRKDRPQPSDPAYVPHSAAYATSVGRPAATASAGESPAQRTARALREAGAGVVLKPSVGEHGTVFVTGRDGGPGATPSVTIAAEQYNMIARMIEHDLPVKLRVSVQSRFYDADNGDAFNVIGELPGSDPAVRDEVVMIGAHLDSWHTGVGATDNADGSVTMMEAMRILKASGVRTRRTIRVALWGGEEQGLLGSKAWVQQHLMGEANRAARDKFDVYFNSDNGYGPIYGFYLENSAAVRPIFDAWLEPLKAIGGRRNVIEGVGSTDHLSFIDAGVPGFNPIQNYQDYDIRDHHTNVDTAERLDVSELRQAAVAMAWFAYQAANADAKIPRPAKQQ